MVVTMGCSFDESNAYALTIPGISALSIYPYWDHASCEDQKNDAYLFSPLMDATDLVYFQGQVRSKEASTVEM
jgi:hypothetical protein